MKNPFLLALATFLCFYSQDSLGQFSIEHLAKDWHLADKDAKGFYGISLDKAYELIKGKTPKKKVIVAVIDSGIDTTHEDLKGMLWKNPKEIPGNSIDDDRNGYVDDIHGWNFIGGKDGKNVSKDSDEASRVYYKYRKIFGDSLWDQQKLETEKLMAYRTYRKAKEQVESQAKDAAMYVLILKDIVAKLPNADSTLRIAMNKKTFTGEELLQFKSNEPDVAKARSVMLGLFQQTRQMNNINSSLVAELTQFYEGQKSKVEAYEKEPRNYRGEVVKDNYQDPADRFYGNNDIMGPDPSHGTHVSGIIAANRKNALGIQGIADHVEIMQIRTVPDGDEHDKDVANAIRYAVDQGAWVINMSFGKSFSPEKKWVDEAVRYAESKDVLLVHAAGNDAKNIDVDDNFPSKYFSNDTSTYCRTWINVGASGPSDKDIVASFSNYGKREVSVFAPGYRIYSSLPGGNAYGEQNGTSMASPVVAGIAALVLSYYPDLSAFQVKDIIEKSVVKLGEKEITLPGTEDEKRVLTDLCSTGGIVNAYHAMQMAAFTKGTRLSTPPASPPKKNAKTGK